MSTTTTKTDAIVQRIAEAIERRYAEGLRTV